MLVAEELCYCNDTEASSRARRMGKVGLTVSRKIVMMLMMMTSRHGERMQEMNRPSASSLAEFHNWFTSQMAATVEAGLQYSQESSGPHLGVAEA